MTGISARLRASVKYGAVNGDSSERAVCGHQMLEAAEIIDRLHESKERLKAEKAELRAALRELITRTSVLRSIQSSLEIAGVLERRPETDPDLTGQVLSRARAALAATERSK